MIALSEAQTPLGLLSVAECRERLLAVHFGGIEALRETYPGLEALGEQRRVPLRPAGARLVHYLLGGPRGRVSVDLSLVAGLFDRRVLAALFRTASGSTLSYGELAARVGRPGAARAVGGAMRRNPLPIVIPCHRVLPATGAIGNYTGGVDKKRWLLEREKRA